MDPQRPVSQIMSKDLVKVLIDDSFEKVRSIFYEYDFHHIPVITEEQILVGIISKKDLLDFEQKLSENTSGRTYSEMKRKNQSIAEVMTPNPLTLEPDDTIGLAADIILANKFHSIPIVFEFKLVGLITSHDLIEFAFQKVLATKSK